MDCGGVSGDGESHHKGMFSQKIEAKMFCHGSASDDESQFRLPELPERQSVRLGRWADDKEK